MKEKIQAPFIALFTMLFSWIGLLVIPVLALVVFNLIDYITRFAANKATGVTNQSKKSIKGIYKKFGMWAVIASCAVIDLVIMKCGQQVGVTISNIPFKFIIATIVAIWFVFNEFISILENVREMGTKVPRFVLSLADKILGKVEEKGQTVVDSIDKGAVKNEN